MTEGNSIQYAEHFQQEDGKILTPGEFAQMNPGLIPNEIYKNIHANASIICHDAIVNYEGKALLAIRQGIPAQGVLSPLGGSSSKGVPLEESLLKRIREECGLDLDDVRKLGMQRVVWKQDPFGHGKGTDTFNFMFYLRGRGELNMDPTVDEPVLVSPEEYTQQYRSKLHPYTQDFMDAVMPIIEKER